ncbi:MULTISPECIES: hypothetical protein [Methylobacterium]|jgi:hypothetical protein|uniref:Uncharacterized protein n=2 Tax=Methylobacterium TaxID=407 RepID=A0A2R4WRR6_9HYPH|nr:MULTISPECIES: hypothetical protein [Methylobacterium]AWB24223.1 hypothetical protein DA075_27860 [Methylobacterium currus]NGM35089.1 hypothetical protein [Methylobacterium sp. DB0501]
MPRPVARPLLVDGLNSLDAAELRKRLSLAMAVVRAASIEGGGVRSLDSAIRRAQADLASASRLAIQDLAYALADHERGSGRGPPPDTPPVAAIHPARLPRLTPRTP